MNINCQPPLQFVYFSTDTHIPWISHNTLRDRLFKNGVAIRKKVYWLWKQNIQNVVPIPLEKTVKFIVAIVNVFVGPRNQVIRKRRKEGKVYGPGKLVSK